MIMLQNRKTLALEILLLGAFIATVYLVDYTPFTGFDDAYIFVRYARNIMDGHGYVWNVGDAPVDGLTSPLWLLMVLAAWPFATPENIMNAHFMSALGLGAGIVFIIVYYKIIQAILPQRFCGFAFLPILLLWAGNYNLGFHMRTGMETLLGATLLCAYLYGVYCLCVRDEFTARRGLWLGALGFACVLARPEYGLAAVGAPACGWLISRDRGRGREFLSALAVSAALLLVYGAWRLWYFHELFPLPFYIKGSLFNFVYEDYNQNAGNAIRATQLYYIRGSIPEHLVVIGGLLYRRRGRALMPVWLPLYALVAYISTTVQIMGNFNRYYFGIEAALLALAAMAWRDEEDAPAVALHPLTRARAGMELGLTATVALLTVWSLCYPWTTANEYVSAPAKSGRYRPMKPLMALPAGTTIATTEVGMLGALVPQCRIYDVAGLNDPVFARGFDVDEFYRRKPDIITLLHSHYEGMTRRIMNDPRFADYEKVIGIPPETTEPQLLSAIWMNSKAPNADVLRETIKRVDAEWKTPE
ncbi:hypothetical protein BH09SUM1_BH09SUM1_28820 [soil metagenome]